MASFLRKLVKSARSRSESKSPAKYPPLNQQNLDRWNSANQFGEPSGDPGQEYFEEYVQSALKKDHVRRTQSSNYCDPNEYFQISPKILSTPQPSRRANGFKLTPNLGRKTNSRNSSRQHLNSGDSSRKPPHGNFQDGNSETSYPIHGSNPRFQYTENTLNSNPYNEIVLDRPRSLSPKKSPKEEFRSGTATPRLEVRTKSPKRKHKNVANVFDYLNPQCKSEGCSAAIIVDDSRFLVCKHQLSHASKFFQTLFIDSRAFPVEGVEQIAVNEYTVVVSGLRYPPSSTQFQWFVESVIPCPTLKDITEETLETCMRLSKRFQAKGLEVRAQKYICENVEMKPPVMAFVWLNWILKHRFDKKCLEAVMPTVARLSLSELESHRQMITEKIMADLLAMKLRACYQQASIAFQTIHQMDHFQVDVEKCPRCNRIREQGRIRLYANPCQKLIGCERCLQNHNTCELGKRLKGTDYQAFYQCDHGLWPFNDRTEDCHCQIGLYKTQLHASRIKVASEADLPKNLEPQRSPSKSGQNNSA